jgi:hypothetical protein
MQDKHIIIVGLRRLVAPETTGDMK